MNASRALLLLLCLGLCSGAWAAEPMALPGKVRAASEEWKDYSQADGKGMAWDILREVFEPAGVRLETRSVPYTRSIGLVQRGEVDVQVGAYLDESEGVLYPQWHYDIDHIYALGLASKPSPTLATVGNYRLVWMRGYEYDSYLPDIRKFNEVHRAVGILPMLVHDRADFYIDALMEIENLLAEAENPQQFKLSPLINLPLYLGFADTENGRVLRNLFDRRMAELVKNGRLKPIFERWKQPYPFDDHGRPPKP
ncbi:substrate-binding periplasmic protein [Pseudomonas fluorescens]|uniref:Transporter substrate-binding domain-containing protein n=1 Tax=Pseudomonas fluorescens TaxID=294 RepID=A0A944HAD8_PSEFL|nr:transporter substrate-binding domain-containing protein [Pseudomonas fluorescens]MBT2312047.1 transporter substrate-binding domain-containing protein [Pseudomonas fluorescens]MBT2316998.1 transporter substrate-binding domain-containing protein [Pseudomonas fluorescens]MBT2327190.1 transporter substrate-binding domain-containing protein [Pseudomonas fluorescens]MBT2344817.1 transporter substrate-binding domain-containing protein [Pseudomonas fluorescens]MBT2347793.1 transporter substrate-bin